MIFACAVSVLVCIFKFISGKLHLRCYNRARHHRIIRYDNTTRQTVPIQEEFILLPSSPPSGINEESENITSESPPSYAASIAQPGEKRNTQRTALLPSTEV